MRSNRKWTAEEKDALLAGIYKHGVGNWVKIENDPEFAAKLVNRTNVQLKDKWRSLSKELKISSGNTSPVEIEVPRNPNLPNPSPNTSLDTSNESRCNAMVFEAISTISDENGSDYNGILSFIEERHEVPQNFGRLLRKSLRLLVSQNILEMTRNRYKIATTKAIEPAQVNQEDYLVSTTSKETQEKDSAEFHFREFEREILPNLISQGKLEKVLDCHEISELERKVFEEAPEVVAKKLAEADNKSFIAAEAIKEAQQMEKLADESDTMLRFCLEIYQQSALGKEVLLW